MGYDRMRYARLLSGSARVNSVDYHNKLPLSLLHLPAAHAHRAVSFIPFSQSLRRPSLFRDAWPSVLWALIFRLSPVSSLLWRGRIFTSIV